MGGLSAVLYEERDYIFLSCGDREAGDVAFPYPHLPKSARCSTSISSKYLVWLVMWWDIDLIPQ